MAANIYVFWKLVADPPNPWTRLTRTNKYARLTDNTALHGTTLGAATHNNHTLSGWSCGNCSSSAGANDGTLTSIERRHSNHSAPGSPSITSNNNLPLAYGLDIIYMDLALWESHERRFPQGAIIVSNGALTEGSDLSRFTSADGRLIKNETPGTLSGSSSSQGHTVSGTTGSGGASGSDDYDGGSASQAASHTHSISLASSTSYLEPRVLVTRLYEALLTTSQALAETVVFVDDTPGANWEILTAWAGANLKAGNQDPALSGSDTHTHTVSGTSGNWSGTIITVIGTGGAGRPHNHSISFSLSSVSHIPESVYLIPARLVNTLTHPAGMRRIYGMVNF